MVVGQKYNEIKPIDEFIGFNKFSNLAILQILTFDHTGSEI